MEDDSRNYKAVPVVDKDGLCSTADGKMDWNRESCEEAGETWQN